MKSATRLVEAVSQLTTHEDSQGRVVAEVNVVYLAPALHIDVISARFEGRSMEARIDELQQWLSMTGRGEAGFLTATIAGLPVVLNVLTPLESEEKKKWAGRASVNSWVSSFLPNPPTVDLQTSITNAKFVHFYGYKGGQGRSSVMALLAKMMADDGYRVLLVDADIEAPSLDALLGGFALSFEQTLMGLCGWSDDIVPLAGVYYGVGNGFIDLLPCRPRGEDADLDFALLTATAPLDVRLYERAADRLAKYIEEQSAYDLVFVDHRTGIASSVLPLLSRLVGPSVVFARTDTNIAPLPSELRRVLRAILQRSPNSPGAFVSFSLDPNRKSDDSRNSGAARIREELLHILSESLGIGQEPSVSDFGSLSIEDLQENWIDWYLDRSLLGVDLPNVSNLQKDNISALHRLRRAVGLPVERMQRERADGITGLPLRQSGARDEGHFIHIPEVERLFLEGNPYTYILGRKGTGKTRLLREVASRGLGTPILVASDETSFLALRSKSAEVDEWLEASFENAKVFWWSLLYLAVMSVKQNRSVLDVLKAALKEGHSPETFSRPSLFKSQVAGLVVRQTFLIDGLENLVRASEIRSFVSTLLEVMGTIQNDAELSSKITLRAFIREDLAADAVQNIEQQLEGRVLRLNWSAGSILNFAVSRLPSLDWISENFADVCEEINKNLDLIRRSLLTEQYATELLLRIFPSRIRRNNLSTATFLRLYFSDTGGDDTNKATFYPRLYLGFLQRLDVLCASTVSPLTSDSRINSSLLNTAYDESSRDFINETKQELVFLLRLEDTDPLSATLETAEEKVTRFVASFEGESTPFEYEKLVARLSEREGFTEPSVRESLRKMKAIRMFEDRPGFSGWWRVGQLYKTGLRMKYVR